MYFRLPFTNAHNKKPKYKKVYLDSENNRIYQLETWDTGVFSKEEQQQWLDLKKYLKESNTYIYCSLIGWDNFLERVAFCGHIGDFKSYIRRNLAPNTIYHLTDAGRILPAEIVHK